MSLFVTACSQTPSVICSSSPIASTSAQLAHTSVPTLPPSHGVHVATLHFRSHSVALSQLDLAVEFAQRAAYALHIPVGRPAALPITTELLTVPRGPFVHKKSQENFWRRTHKRAIKVWDANEAVVQTWVEYLSQNPVPGVGVRVQQMVYRPVGFGQAIQERTESDFVEVDTSIKEMADSLASDLSAEPPKEEPSKAQEEAAPTTASIQNLAKD